MKTLRELQKQYYEEFRGLPYNGPIVRNNQESDAFELVVLQLLFGKELPDFISENASVLAKYIVPAPDGGIDIFFQHEDGDEYTFDVIQVKDTRLSESEIKSCITDMKRCIRDYLNDPMKVKSESCRARLSDSDLAKENVANCIYSVVHTGEVDSFRGSGDDERVITYKDLENLYKNSRKYQDSVDCATIRVANATKREVAGNTAYICDINGFELAELYRQYGSSQAGRSLLFGCNVRETLMTKKDSRFQSMKKTVTECPEKFWFYNNGITITAREINEKDDGELELKGFSIVNGAQTTGALGLFWDEVRTSTVAAELEDVINSTLKNVYVLARIDAIPDKGFREDIATYSNTQTPISSQDMVANRPEQRHLNEWLLDDEYAKIYCRIRRGGTPPENDFRKGIAHRVTSNDLLAQLAYSAFCQKPYTAKDKKKTLFIKESQSQFVVNKLYHEIFCWDEENPNNNGVIFKKTKQEIDELLFVCHLYKESKRLEVKHLKKMIDHYKEQKENEKDYSKKEELECLISSCEKKKSAASICMFYFVALYYQFKTMLPLDDEGVFQFERYYSDKEYKQALIESVVGLFLEYTAEVLVDTAVSNGYATNINNWVRQARCEEEFFKKTNTDLIRLKYRTDYEKFCREFKV